MDDFEILILRDYFIALQSSQARLVRCLGFKVFREEWIKEYNG